MLKLLYENEKYLYFIWAAFWLIRIWLNGKVYEEQENKSLEETKIPFTRNWASMLVLTFVFWFRDYKYEKIETTKKAMRTSDLFGIFLMAYTIAILSFSIAN